MPSFFRSAATLAMAGAAFANPLKRGDDSCLAAVTGKAALGDDGLRKEHCSSFIKTIVTPSAVTVTTTITDAPSASSEWSNYKRDVTVCPNEVPNYASACKEAGYKSACSVYGVTGETTFTIPATTTTKTVYVGKGGNGGNSGNNGVCTSTTTSVFSTTKTGCSGGITTSTVTETAKASTITSISTVTNNATTVDVTKTITVTASANVTAPFPTAVAEKCLSDADATEFTDAFKTLLEYTSYTGAQGPPGRGYKSDVSAKYLAEDFKDYSDSINWMANFPLGGITFDGRAAFDYGQGVLQPELTVETLSTSHSCKEITWRWHATTPSQASVIGINHMILSDDLSQIKINYAEFDNAAWLYSFGLDCKVPDSSSNTTTAASRRKLF